MPFDLQPVLRGELLELRPLRAGDFDALFAVAADPRIWEQHPASDRHQEEQFRIFFREALDSGGALIAADTGDGATIGSSRFHGYDEQRSEVEIGWTFLARSRWGGRYNGEMKRLMLHHAFRFVNRVVFLVGPNNRRSQRAMEKIGGSRLALPSPNGPAATSAAPPRLVLGDPPSSSITRRAAVRRRSAARRGEHARQGAAASQPPAAKRTACPAQFASNPATSLASGQPHGAGP